MIFAPDLAARITQGKKTVTRRPVKYVQDVVRAGEMLIPHRCTYEVGRTYAVQLGRGMSAVDRIRVLDVQRETLDLPLSWTEAAMEGFSSPAAFTNKWVSLYGRDYPRDVWRIAFEMVA